MWFHRPGPKKLLESGQYKQYGYRFKQMFKDLKIVFDKPVEQIHWPR